MKMIRKDRKSKQINPETGGQSAQLLFDPVLSMVVVLAGDGIGPSQKTTANHAIHHMQYGNFIRRKNLNPRSSIHKTTL